MKRVLLLLLFLSTAFHGFSQNEMKIQMIFVKGGSFYMGCDDPKFHGEEYDDERPVHRVSVSSFYLCKYEVTLGQYRHIMGMYPPAYNGIDYGNKYCDDCPVVKISWDDAQEFIRRVNKKYNKHYRLPTETEWEYAARGGLHSKNCMFSGSNNAGTVAWFGRRNGTTHPVGQKEPNELGIYDMSGNVAEWCADWYGPEYYQGTVDNVNPKGPEKGDKRICRGGSYFDEDVACRVVDRGRYEPNTSQWNIGFRLAMDEHP
jgi:formylglycine-generating enzyme